MTNAKTAGMVFQAISAVSSTVSLSFYFCFSVYLPAPVSTWKTLVSLLRFQNTSVYREASTGLKLQSHAEGFPCRSPSF